MIRKPILFLTIQGIAIGLFVGIFDSIIHSINIEYFKVISFLLFLLFFVGLYRSVVFFRNRIKSGIIIYKDALKNIIYIGMVATVAISVIRYVFLQYYFKSNISNILDHTKQSMIENYSLYTDEELYNMMSFIEFTYNPIVSTLMYFVYYSIFVIIFAFLASFLVKRTNNNI